MTGLVIAVVLLGVGAWLLWSGLLGGLTGSVRDELDRERMRRELLSRDADLAREHRRARRAMNDAAGQSWRNPFE